MLDVGVIDNAAAALALDPIRSRLLAELATPASAAALATRLRIPRQRINYHLRSLEEHGLVQVAARRQWGGLVERLMIASAASYVVSPRALGRAAADPARRSDRLSATYLVALAGRAIEEVGSLMRKAKTADKRLATLSLDTEIHFRSAAERAEFARELTMAVADLAARYHDPAAAGARSHRVLVLAHPLPERVQRQTSPSKTEHAEEE